MPALRVDEETVKLLLLQLELCLTGLYLSLHALDAQILLRNGKCELTDRVSQVPDQQRIGARDPVDAFAEVVENWRLPIRSLEKGLQTRNLHFNFLTNDNIFLCRLSADFVNLLIQHLCKKVVGIRCSLDGGDN